MRDLPIAHKLAYIFFFILIRTRGSRAEMVWLTVIKLVCEQSWMYRWSEIWKQNYFIKSGIGMNWRDVTMTLTYRVFQLNSYLQNRQGRKKCAKTAFSRFLTCLAYDIMNKTKTFLWVHIGTIEVVRMKIGCQIYNVWKM